MASACERLRDRLDRELDVGVARDVNLAVERCDGDRKPIRVRVRELGNIGGDLSSVLTDGIEQVLDVIDHGGLHGHECVTEARDAPGVGVRGESGLSARQRPPRAAEHRVDDDRVQQADDGVVQPSPPVVQAHDRGDSHDGSGVVNANG